MQTNRISATKFTWFPPHLKAGRYSYPNRPTPKNLESIENRKPFLRLARKPTNTIVEELYLINNSPHFIEFVLIQNRAMVTIDEKAHVLADKTYSYEHIQPAEAVKIDEYDNYYDIDYMINVDLIIKAEFLGYKRIAKSPEKGGIKNMVLLWSNLTSGKNVTIDNCNNLLCQL